MNLGSNEYWSRIPHERKIQILVNVENLKDILTACTVNKALSDICKDDFFWRQLLSKRYKTKPKIINAVRSLVRDNIITYIEFFKRAGEDDSDIFELLTIVDKIRDRLKKGVYDDITEFEIAILANHYELFIQVLDIYLDIKGKEEFPTLLSSKDIEEVLPFLTKQILSISPINHNNVAQSVILILDKLGEPVMDIVDYIIDMSDDKLFGLLVEKLLGHLLEFIGYEPMIDKEYIKPMLSASSKLERRQLIYTFLAERDLVFGFGFLNELKALELFRKIIIYISDVSLSKISVELEEFHPRVAEEADTEQNRRWMAIYGPTGVSSPTPSPVRDLHTRRYVSPPRQKVNYLLQDMKKIIEDAPYDVVKDFNDRELIGEILALLHRKSKD